MNVTAVVVTKILIDTDYFCGRGGVGNIRIIGVHAIATYNGVAGRVGVVDIKIAVAGIIGMKSQPQQALFTTTIGQGVNIQKRCWQLLAVFNDDNITILFHHKQSIRSIIGMANRDRIAETVFNYG